MEDSCGKGNKSRFFLSVFVFTVETVGCFGTWFVRLHLAIQL